MIKRKIGLARAYRNTFATPEGEIVLGDLLRAGGVMEICHQPGDAHATAFKDGRRSLALHIIDQLRWSEPELLRLARQRSTEAVSDASDQEF